MTHCEVPQAPIAQGTLSPSIPEQWQIRAATAQQCQGKRAAVANALCARGAAQHGRSSQLILACVVMAGRTWGTLSPSIPEQWQIRAARSASYGSHSTTMSRQTSSGSERPVRSWCCAAREKQPADPGMCRDSRKNLGETGLAIARLLMKAGLPTGTPKPTRPCCSRSGATH